MQAGTLYYRVIARRLQGTGTGTQFILLGGFDARLTSATATYYETLSPGHWLKRSEIDLKVAQMKQHGNAADVRDVTDGTVAKRLARLWDTEATRALVDGLVRQGERSFASLRIGQYL